MVKPDPVTKVSKIFGSNDIKRRKFWVSASLDSGFRLGYDDSRYRSILLLLGILCNTNSRRTLSGKISSKYVTFDIGEIQVNNECITLEIHRIFGTAIFGSAILNMAVPAAARSGTVVLIFVRILQGLFEVRALIPSHPGSLMHWYNIRAWHIPLVTESGDGGHLHWRDLD